MKKAQTAGQLWMEWKVCELEQKETEDFQQMMEDKSGMEEFDLWPPGEGIKHQANRKK